MEIVTLRRHLERPDPPVIWPAGIAQDTLRVADAPDIHALLHRAYANGFGQVQADWREWFDWMRHDPEFDQKLCFVARADAEIVGFCLVWTSGFIKDLVVDPARHGQGIGTALLSSAIGALRELGHTELRLRAAARNTSALRFYDALGFLPI